MQHTGAGVPSWTSSCLAPTDGRLYRCCAAHADGGACTGIAHPFLAPLPRLHGRSGRGSAAPSISPAGYPHTMCMPMVPCCTWDLCCTWDSATPMQQPPTPAASCAQAPGAATARDGPQRPLAGPCPWLRLPRSQHFFARLCAWLSSRCPGHARGEQAATLS